MLKSYLRAFQLGIIAGMRSMSAPALLSHKLARTIPTPNPQTPAQYLAQPTAATALKVLAAGEFIGDKLPNAPNRTSPAGFAGRIVSGASCGAILSDVEGKAASYGAVAGGLGAVVGTLVFFNLRRWLDHDLGLPDAVGAVAEDALTIAAGWYVVNGIQPAPQTA